MKSYTITVNGTAYEVNCRRNRKRIRTGSSTGSSSEGSTGSRLLKQHRAGAGSVKVTASVPGKVLKIVASVGQAVKAGDNIVILESMKMEIPVVAPQDGTVASIDVAEGASVENGDTLATMN